MRVVPLHLRSHSVPFVLRSLPLSLLPIPFTSSSVRSLFRSSFTYSSPPEWRPLSDRGTTGRNGKEVKVKDKRPNQKRE